jgi:hypothetical protein
VPASGNLGLESSIDTGRIRKRLRELSKSLLGAQFRAEIAALIADGEPPFWARRVASQLGIPENKVAAELSRFANEGLLVEISVAAWDRRKLYERGPGGSMYWRGAYELLERAAGEEALRSGVSTASALRAYLDEVQDEVAR